VRFIINAHYHGDHIGGNAYFQKQAPVIAHDNVRKRLQTGGPRGNGGSMRFETSPQPLDALPIITYDHVITSHLNGENVRVQYFPPATRMAPPSFSSQSRTSCTWATSS